MEGFTDRPALADLAALARRFSVPLVEDQGSGWLGLDIFTPDAFPAEARAVLEREPAVRESVRDGADLVAFSGDKLLGGPQAGLLVGRADLITRIRQHPLMRAVRADKLTYAGLEATPAGIHERPRHDRRAGDADARDDQRLNRCARESIAAQLRASGVPCDTAPGHSTVGGGSLPGETLPTRLVRIESISPDTLLAALRHGQPAVVARIVDDHVCLDPRTVSEEDDGPLARAVFEAAGRLG